MNKNNLFEISKPKPLLNESERQHITNHASGMDQEQIFQLDQEISRQAYGVSCGTGVIAFATTAYLLGHSALQAQEVIMPLITHTSDPVLRVSQLTANTAATIGLPLTVASGIFKATGEVVYNAIAKPIARRQLKSNINQALTSEGISPLE